MRSDLVKRLRQMAEKDRAIQENNEVVAAALRGQVLLFDQDVRSPSNTFAVRLALDHGNCAKNDAILAQTWDEAADRIEQLEAKLAKAAVALKRSYEGWSNALELGIIAKQHRTSAGILRDDARATIEYLKGGDT